MSKRKFFLILFLLTGGLSLKGQVLLNDPFDAILKSGDGQYTKANVFKGERSAPGGGVRGTVKVEAGKTGHALRLSGNSQLIYSPAQGNLDPMGGELSFAVKLNFDPMEKNEKTRTILRNQILLTVQCPPGRTSVCIYNSGMGYFAIAVENAEGTIVFGKNFQKVFKPGQWHTLGLKWGREMQLWCDGEKQASGPWEGLFGSIPASLKEGRILIGAAPGSGLENEFSIDDLVITGPSTAQIATRPRISLPLLKESVTIDGALDEPFWKKASRVTGFVRFDRNELVANQPTVYTAYKEQGIYIGLDAKLPAGITPRATLTARDSAVYNEDGLEVHLNPLGDSHVYQFIASALGTRFDHKVKAGEFRGEIGGYQPEWQVKTKGRSGGWTAETVIPFASFDGKSMPKPGDVWTGNFCLNSADGYTSASTWSYVNSKNFIVPTYFGELLFTGTERTLRENRLVGFDSGEPQIDFELIGDYKPIITATCEMFDSAAARIYKNPMLIKDATAISFKLPIVMTGNYLVMVSGVDETGVTVFRQSVGFKTEKSFDLAVENYPFGGYLKFQTTVKSGKEPFGKVVVTVTGSDKNAAGTVTITKLRNGVGIGHLANETLKPGVYQIQATLYSDRGTVLETAKQTIKLFEKPSWWKNTLGIDHSVPPPFQPVEDRREKLSVWGRDHVLGKGNFPLQVISQEKEMFAAPPSFVLKADGQTIDLTSLTAEKGESLPDAVSRIAQTKVGALLVQTQSTLEFDGMLRYDLSLKPAASVKVESLVMEIALPRDLAKFILTSNCWTSSISYLDKEYIGAFTPYVWIGNDTMGFSWFAEKDQYWNPRDSRVIQAIPATDKVVFRVNFITQPETINQPITLTFGFQATPLRPIPKTPRLPTQCIGNWVTSASPSI